MTENLIQRLDHHNHPINGEKYTARGIPWEFFLSIACESKIHAAKLERLIKSKKSRVFIQNLKLYPELVSKITWEANTRLLISSDGYRSWFKYTGMEWLVAPRKSKWLVNKLKSALPAEDRIMFSWIVKIDHQTKEIVVMKKRIHF